MVNGFERTNSRDLTLGIILILQTTVGLLGNFSLLYHIIFLYVTGCRSRCTDLILRHPTVANTMVHLSRGVPQIMAAFGRKNFLNDFAYQSLFCVHRVDRGVSIGSPWLLRIFQAIIINPRNSSWADLRVKAPQYMGVSIILCWIMHMLVSVIFPMFLSSNQGDKTTRDRKDFGYCTGAHRDKTADALYAVLLSFPDAVSLALMLLASSSMVFILHRHKQRVKDLHRNSISPRSSPETRATQTILVLVSTFVFFYTLSIIFQFVIVSVFHPTWWMMNLSTLSDVCFPTTSPFILMSGDSRVSQQCLTCIRKMNPPCFVHLKKTNLFTAV
ncbi:vomeronasal type-1 receptor 4-like [Tenrec ecaudatus]|uniref:vomeronasal type-1 receptor 4-like n=1 Tax=Tenrec ecaudatus TaxID=94439 RepID=UPI003F5974D5